MVKKLQKRRPAPVTLPAYISCSDLGAHAPIQNFRPSLWRLLQRHSNVLKLDLFWPNELDTATEDDQLHNSTGIEDEDPTIFPYEGLRPLLTFRNLHTLQLTGMLRSYQPLIWATCWLNPNLTTLHLEMALEPLINISSDVLHGQIDSTWTLKAPVHPEQEIEYLGHHGTGALHEEFGDGEYLDTQAIKMAQYVVADEIPEANMLYLPIKKLILSNIVVDAWPMEQWFDPKRLEEIVFKPGCIDAGFYLPFDGMHTNVTVPSPLVGSARMIKAGELKIIDLKKGKVVSRKDAVTGKEELAITKHPLRHKISQIFSLNRKTSQKRNKENKTAAVEADIQDVDSRFSDVEAREARNGKKPAQ